MGSRPRRDNNRYTTSSTREPSNIEETSAIRQLKIKSATLQNTSNLTNGTLKESQEDPLILHLVEHGRQFCRKNQYHNKKGIQNSKWLLIRRKW